MAHSAFSADTYAILFNAVVSGRSPYDDALVRSAATLAMAIVNGGRPNFPDDIRPSWRALVDLCWAGESSLCPDFAAMSTLQFISDGVDGRRFNEYRRKVLGYRQPT